MRVFMLVCAMVLFCGCQPTTEVTYLTLDELKATTEFEGFDVVIEPDKEGPYRIIQNATNDIPWESRTPLKRQTNYDGQKFVFEYQDSQDYAFRSHILRTKSGEMTSVLLRSKDKVQGRGRGNRGGQDDDSDDKEKSRPEPDDSDDDKKTDK